MFTAQLTFLKMVDQSELKQWCVKITSLFVDQFTFQVRVKRSFSRSVLTAFLDNLSMSTSLHSFILQSIKILIWRNRIRGIIAFLIWKRSCYVSDQDKWKKRSEDALHAYWNVIGKNGNLAPHILSWKKEIREQWELGYLEKSFLKCVP